MSWGVLQAQSRAILVNARHKEIVNVGQVSGIRAPKSLPGAKGKRMRFHWAHAELSGILGRNSMSKVLYASPSIAIQEGVKRILSSEILTGIWISPYRQCPRKVPSCRNDSRLPFAQGLPPLRSGHGRGDRWRAVFGQSGIHTAGLGPAAVISPDADRVASRAHQASSRVGHPFGHRFAVRADRTCWDGKRPSNSSTSPWSFQATNPPCWTRSTV